MNPRSSSRRSARATALAAVAFLAFASPGRAQWITQSFELRPGWNAIFSHVDASHETLDTLVGGDAANPILEIWRWNPPLTAQFVNNPVKPIEGSDWLNWVRTEGSHSLQRLVGDSAYLVRVGSNVTTYTWQVKGQPVVPRHEWNITGLNLIGFSTVASGPPNFEAFLTQSPDLRNVAEVFQYVGGNLSVNNPQRVLAPRATGVKRGQAFWMRSGTNFNLFNRYFGPFEVAGTGAKGFQFGTDLSTYRFRLHNLTSNSLTVTARLSASEAPPAGQPLFGTLPALLVRGELNSTNLTYGYSRLNFDGTQSWTLAPKGQPGSQVEIVLGLDRNAMSQNEGDLLAGILRFTDSLGQLRVDVPVSATIGSSAGLWIGGAELTHVRHYLKSYQRNGPAPVTDASGRYVVTNIDTSLGPVARTFPLRLIVHNPGDAANALLLQRVYLGLDSETNEIVATRESALNRNFIDQSRRVSASHLPWSQTNAPWAFSGKWPDTTNLVATVTLGHDDHSSNPFLHTFHPDHDNLNAQFSGVQPQGSESYSVRRQITLTVQPPELNFGSLTAGNQTIGGEYSETITVLGLARGGGTTDARQFEVRGVFTLSRMSDVPVLTTNP